MTIRQLYILHLLRTYGPQSGEQIAAAAGAQCHRQLDRLVNRNRIERDRTGRYFLRPREWAAFCRVGVRAP